MNVAKDRVWPVLNDFVGHYRFNPYVEYSPIVNGITQGLGSERELRLYDGPVVKQKIIDYEEGRMILVGITESSWPIKRGWTRITLEATGEEACQLEYHLNYVPSLGPLGPLIGLYYKPVFTSQYNVVLRSVEEYVTTGRAIHAGVSDLQENPPPA
jgi:hypothetical protein